MHKVLAYFLLCVGLAVMFFGFISMYKVFVDRKPVLNVVQMKDTTVNTQYGPVQVQTTGLNSLVNICLFTFFMIFLISLGAKTANVGINLLKVERIHDGLLALRAQDVRANEERLKKL